MQFITLFDYALLPFYLAIIYAVAYHQRNRWYPKHHPWRKYYLPALSLKIGGAIFIGFIYQYYYGGGDTAEYFRHARVVNSSFDESFSKWINLLLRIPSRENYEYYNYISQMQWYGDDASYTVVSFTAFLSILTFNTYLPTTVLFAFISFSGVWALFRTFASLHPHLTRPVAIATLFIPSVFVWGSGIFKDTICMFGLGWLTYGIFRMMLHRDFRGSNILLTVLSFLLLAKVKLYILLAFMPALLMWVFFNYTQKIRNDGQRWLAKLLLSALVVAGFLFFMQRFSKSLGKYSLENIAYSSYETRWWLSYVSNIEQGSVYDLGEFSPTLGGMLTKFPAAVNVTLFRPYLWEVKKPIVALSGLEALLFLFLTLKILFVVGPVKIWKTVSMEPTIQFCFIFAIIFAFAVGISSYNFGALSRYKIPCMPFYALGLIMLYYKNKPLKKPLLTFPFRI
jgi:hypothetical protein